MENLKRFIEKYTNLSGSDWQIIQDSFNKKEFAKNEIILEQGKTCKHFYFLEKGLLRFYYIIDGNDVTKTFTLAPYCFTSKTSFRNQEPANEGIQALENTIVWQTTYENYKKLENLNSWNIFMRKILNEIQEYTDGYLLEAKIETAENRYKKLLEKYPASLMQNIPLRHLASFLGVAPQSLSRIRKKLHEERKS